LPKGGRTGDLVAGGGTTGSVGKKKREGFPPNHGGQCGGWGGDGFPWGHPRKGGLGARRMAFCTSTENSPRPGRARFTASNSVKAVSS